MASKNLLHPIPQPPRTPLLGNLLSLGTVHPVQDMMKLARELGPIYWLDMMGSPLVIISGQELVNELCDEKRFDKTTRGTLRRLRVIGGDALFTADTQMPNWSKAHSILLPTFSHRAMQGYHPMMLDIAEQMMLKWERLNADDEIDVTHDMTCLTLAHVEPVDGPVLARERHHVLDRGADPEREQVAQDERARGMRDRIEEVLLGHRR